MLAHFSRNLCKRVTFSIFVWASQLCLARYRDHIINKSYAKFSTQITSIWFSYALFDIELKCIRKRSAGDGQNRMYFPCGDFSAWIVQLLFACVLHGNAMNRKTPAPGFYEIKETTFTYVICFQWHDDYTNILLMREKFVVIFTRNITSLIRVVKLILGVHCYCYFVCIVNNIWKTVLCEQNFPANYI